jgi:1-aminocyclopropane-1-carboxylate deaminase/D-cysteine desulfhydrase-like pyridoxal-dependent ACC family enzyme
MDTRASAAAKSPLARASFREGFASRSEAMARVSLGTYPTPVQELTQASRGRCAVWVKRDDLTGALYGGNKVRKLEYLLADAHGRGATRLVTIGAIGSHHVLATTLYGRREGFSVEAALLPQPRTDHVVEVVRAGLGHGLVPMPAWGFASVAMRVVPRLFGGGAYFITVGGSNVMGSLGYVAAARELAAQIRAGEMPEPDVIVVALGSGGTVAGIAAGLELEGIRSHVVGVIVADPPWLITFRTRRLARACLRLGKRRENVVARGWLDRRLSIDRRWLGAGYGVPTEEGARATEVAAQEGLVLDPTYTAKTFAAALARAEALRDSPAPKTVLYWHTLSSSPVLPLLEGAPDESAIDPGIRRLLL